MAMAMAHNFVPLHLCCTSWLGNVLTLFSKCIAKTLMSSKGTPWNGTPLAGWKMLAVAARTSASS